MDTKHTDTKHTAEALMTRVAAELEAHRADVAAGIAADPELGLAIRRARAEAELADLARIELEAIAWRPGAVSALAYETTSRALDRALATLERYEAQAARKARAAAPRGAR